MPRLGSLFLIGSIALPAPASAAPVDVMPSYLPSAPESTEYMVYGHGRQLCSSYLQAREKAQTGDYLTLNYFRQWIAGYMSSYNLFRLRGKDSIAAEGDEDFIETTLETYCQQHPEARFASASAAIIKQLQSRP